MVERLLHVLWMQSQGNFLIKVSYLEYLTTKGNCFAIHFRCKYVQTDAAGDELVQLQIIHTLSNIIKSPVSDYLTDTTAWDIINASHSILTHIAITGTEKC